MNFILLQDIAPYPSFWAQIAEKGIVFIIMALAVWYLKNKQEATEAKLVKYIEEDRAKMLDVIEQNTEAFRENSRIQELLTEKLTGEKNARH